jgi:hypothetical protein
MVSSSISNSTIFPIPIPAVKLPHEGGKVLHNFLDSTCARGENGESGKQMMAVNGVFFSISDNGW